MRIQVASWRPPRAASVPRQLQRVTRAGKAAEGAAARETSRHAARLDHWGGVPDSCALPHWATAHSCARRRRSRQRRRQRPRAFEAWEPIVWLKLGLLAVTETAPLAVGWMVAV